MAATVFEQLYPAKDGLLSLPYPFSALVEDIRARTGAELQVGFIPLGRSLQRYGADPDYFASPRIILAVTGNGRASAKLRDRLFIGYQPAVAALEVIAFDESVNQFRFLQVEDYREHDRPSFTAIEETNCLACHQSRGPIFSAPPWDESNANPRITVNLPATVSGLPVHQDFDGIDQFARSVQRANRLVAAALLQQKIARKPPGQSVVTALTEAFPQGLSVIDPKIPNRDPAALVASGMAPMDSLETKGAFDPEAPRQPLVLWKPGLAAEADALRLIGEVAIP